MFHPRVTPRLARRHGFSLIELSVVVVILAIVSVAGLEVATQFVGRNAYQETQEKLAVLDQALLKFYKVYGRLPCPATINTSPTNDSAYGNENCPPTGSPLILGNGLTPKRPFVVGAIPFRALNLPMSAALDGYGNRVHYVVTYGLTVATTDPLNTAGTFDGTAATLEIRTGKLAQPCTSNCSTLADPAATPTSSGAAYILLSTGPDKRGAFSKLGVQQKPCITTTGSEIDGQNCLALTNQVNNTTASVSVAGIPINVFYDSRYNKGSIPDNYFDDLIVWRAKGKML